MAGGRKARQRLLCSPAKQPPYASEVFGGAGEAPTREELRIVHEQQMAKAAAKAPAPPYKVTLDLGPPPPLPCATADPPLQ